MILDRLFRRNRESLAPYGQVRRTPGRPISQTPGWLASSLNSSAGVPVDEESALSLSAVFSAVNRLSRIVAMLPLNVFRKQTSGRKEIADTHPANAILHDNFNPIETAFRARHRMEFFRLTWGNAVGEIGWDGSARPRSINPIEPWRARADHDGEYGVVYTIDGYRKVAAGDVIHVPFLTYDGITGRGWLHYALDSIGIGISAEEFAARMYANDARPGGLLVNEGNPNKPARDEFRESWQKHHGGTENRGKVGVLWGGWKWQDYGTFTPEQAQILESRKFTTTEVARWLNIPPHLLADLDRATFSNIEQQGIEFVIYCLASILTDYEQEYNRKILAPPNLYCKHNVNALMRGDMAARAQFYKDLFAIGAFSVNDIIDLEDGNTIGEMGDQRFIPVNMAPLKSFLNPSFAPPQIPGQPPTSEPSPKPAPPKVPANSRPALAVLLADTFTRLGRKEVNEARRSLKEPRKLFAWIDGFYGGFETTLREAMGPACGVATIGSAIPGNQAATDAASKWVADSRRDLLAASECQPEEWPRRIESLLTSWETGRASAAADSVLEVIYAGEIAS